jgi:hypothetical protein
VGAARAVLESQCVIVLHSFRVVLLGGLLLYPFLPTAAKADQIVVLVDDQRAQDLREHR